MRKALLSVVALLLLTLSASAKDVSTYFVGDYISEATATKTLKDAGFEVLATEKIDRKGQYKTIIFTCPTLKKLSSKEGRGFYAIGRAFINEKDKEFRLANPNYFGHSFLQGDYDEVVHNVTDKLLKAFPNLTGSVDKLNRDDLEGYHFMFGMPYYEDMLTVGKGANLLSKVKSKALFTVKLANSTLVGLDLKSRTKKFVKKIGKQNGLVLPYTVLIEDGKAKILDPKYYIAIMYPLLTMGEFTKIATVPGAIETEMKRAFK